MNGTKTDAERAAEYIATGGNNCIFCGSENLRAASGLEHSGTDIYQDVACDGCGREFCDVYSLNRVHIPDAE